VDIYNGNVKKQKGMEGAEFTRGRVKLVSNMGGRGVDRQTQTVWWLAKNWGEQEQDQRKVSKFLEVDLKSGHWPKALNYARGKWNPQNYC